MSSRSRARSYYLVHRAVLDDLRRRSGPAERRRRHRLPASRATRWSPARLLLHGRRPSSSYDSETQLWASDGTQAGTQMVEDFSSISPTSAPAYPVSVNGSLYFTVAGSDGLAQLWTSDGTSQGTTLVKDLGRHVELRRLRTTRATTRQQRPRARSAAPCTSPPYRQHPRRRALVGHVATGTTQLGGGHQPGPGRLGPA